MQPLRSWIDVLFPGGAPQRTLFRVDAGNRPGLGFGHLSRCLLLARILGEKRGAKTLFCMRDIPEGLAHARSRGMEVAVLPADRDGEIRKIVGIMEAFEPGWLVHDLPYPLEDEPLFVAASARGCKTLFMDDSRFVAPDVDVLVNSHVLAPDRVVPQAGTAALLGPDYFLFDHDSGSAVDCVSLPRVLVTFGGADPTGMTGRVVRAMLFGGLPPMKLTVLLGPGFGEEDPAIAEARQSGAVRVVRNAPDALALFREHDLVVTGGGRTMYELLSLDKPFLPVATAPHEAESVVAFIQRSLVRHGLETFDADMFRKMLREELSFL